MTRAFMKYNNPQTGIWESVAVEVLSNGSAEFDVAKLIDMQNKMPTDAEKIAWDAKETTAGSQAKVNALKDTLPLWKFFNNDGTYALTITSGNLFANLKSAKSITFYSEAGVTGNPSLFPCRGFQIGQLNIGTVWAIDSANNIFAGFYNAGDTAIRWNKLYSLETPVWINLTLQNGVKVYPTGTPPQYCKVGNVLYLRGEATNILARDTIVATLPIGFRPSANHSFAQNSSIVAGSINTSRWGVKTTGEIVLEHVSDTNNFQDGKWFPLNTSFIVD